MGIYVFSYVNILYFSILFSIYINNLNTRYIEGLLELKYKSLKTNSMILHNIILFVFRSHIEGLTASS